MKKNRLLTGMAIAAMIAALFSACSSSDSAQNRYMEPPKSEAANYDEYPLGAADSDELIQNLPLLTPTYSMGKKLVYTVDMRLQTTEFESGTKKLLTVTRDLGGYLQSAHVEGRSLYNPGADRFASYVLRIPSEQLADFLGMMEDRYNLVMLDQQSQDVTVRYGYADDRLFELEEQAKRLEEMLEETQGADERLDIERELTDIQSQISGFDASKAAMDSGVLFSTVAVALYEVNPNNIGEQPKETFGVRLDRASSGSVDNMIGFLQGLVLLIVAIWPALVVTAIIGGAILLVIRLGKKRRVKIMKKHRNSSPSASDTENGYCVGMDEKNHEEHTED